MPVLPTVKVASFVLDKKEIEPPKLRYSEGDYYSTEINNIHHVGHAKPLNALIVSCAENGTFEVKARVTQEISFRGMTDIQFNVRKSPLPVELNHIDRALIDKLKGVLETTQEISGFPALPPPFFSREHIPKYLQKQYFHKGISEPRTRGGKSCPWAIEFLTSSPDPPSAGQGPLYEKLIDLFQQRQCWTKLALKNMLIENYPEAELKRNLIKVAYTFINGPWRNVWIKYGVDPRSSPEYKQFQVLELRNKYNAKKLNRTRRRMMMDSQLTRSPESQGGVLSTFQNHIFDGERLTDNFFVYQLCDIVYQPVRERLSKLENSLLTSPNELDGWYPQSTIATLRELIKVRLDQMLKSHSINEEYEFMDILPSENMQAAANEDDSEEEYEIWE